MNAQFDPHAVLGRHTAPVPRYTSYPTAPHFTEVSGSGLFDDFVDEVRMGNRISVYAHIPFCDRLCWFCACHTKQTARYDPVKAYVDSLIDEIGLYRQVLGMKPSIAHLHLGGGSPSMLAAKEFERLRRALDDTFNIDSGSEISLEIDPNEHKDDLLDGLQALGVNRVSIGVQDFDPLVQQAINRPQTFEQTRDLIEAVRSVGIRSVNIDCLYGLPFQTKARLQRTIDQVTMLAPQRIALFGYAHVPWMKKHQRMIDDSQLPGAVERFDQTTLASSLIVEAGYERIGIDHFAMPDDALALAARDGKLHRNFQGYTTDSCAVMLPLGGSSIGRFSGGYVQNIIPTGQYRTSVCEGKIPICKGYRFEPDDRNRAWLIERLMCDFAIDYVALRATLGDAANSLIAEAKQIAADEREGLCESDDTRFFIPAHARPFARIVASRFDAHMRRTEHRYSKAV